MSHEIELTGFETGSFFSVMKVLLFLHAFQKFGNARLLLFQQIHFAFEPANCRSQCRVFFAYFFQLGWDFGCTKICKMFKNVFLKVTRSLSSTFSVLTSNRPYSLLQNQIARLVRPAPGRLLLQSPVRLTCAAQQLEFCNTNGCVVFESFGIGGRAEWMAEEQLVYSR